MTELELKYGLNPDQGCARLSMADGGELPLTVLNGQPGTINLLDALQSWQLVRELREVTGLPAAASFKHVSPAGAALGLPLSETDRRVFFVPEGLALSPLACAYARARGADRLSSYGDWAALSEPCDLATALLLKGEVSDGVIAPDYTDEALEVLRAKKRGRYTVLRMDPAYTPGPLERRELFGFRFQQSRERTPITAALLEHPVTQRRELPDEARRDLLLAMVTLKYTQSNSVCFVKDGQTLGVGAGQQSRIHCTRLAADKADRWLLRRHPKVLALPFHEGLSRPERDNAIDLFLSPEEAEELLAEGSWQRLFTRRPEPLGTEEKRAYLAAQSGRSCGSDAFFPFADNIERCARSGVRYIAQPGGSVRDGDVIAAADRHDMLMCFTGLRLFLH